MLAASTDDAWLAVAAHRLDEATAAEVAVVTDGDDPGKPLISIDIGSVDGPPASIPSAAPRAARLHIVSSGQGSVSTRDILAELPALALAITSGTFKIDTRLTPLTDVEQAWTAAAHTNQHIVITP